jgi:hypothetical protein
MEIKPTKLICGQGLARLMAESSLDTVENLQSNDQVNALLSSLEQA